MEGKTIEGASVTIRDFWTILRRSWVVVAVASAMGIVTALVLSLITTPVYQSKAQLFVSVSANEITGSYTGDLYVRERIESYLTLVDTPRVLDPVIDKLKLDMGYAELAELVEARNPDSTVLIQVLAKDSSATQAATIADATAQSLSKEIVRLETTDSGTTPIKVHLISPGQVSDVPQSPRTTFNLVLGGLVGFMAGVGVAVLRATRKSTKSPEKSTKSPEEPQDATQVSAGHGQYGAAQSRAVGTPTRRGLSRTPAASSDRPGVRV